MKNYSINVLVTMQAHYDIMADDRNEAVRMAERRAIGEEPINMELVSTQANVVDVH